MPAYNIVHLRGPDKPFHPRGAGNGYVITFGDKRVYVAGDTEDVPEMAKLAGVDIAFLPVNLDIQPYNQGQLLDPDCLVRKRGCARKQQEDGRPRP